MNRTDKLMLSLKAGTIDFQDMVTLLKRLGWECKRQKGSHQRWVNGPLKYTLTADFPKYQLEGIRDLILGGKQ